MCVYKEIYSAFIPLAILLAMAIVGAKLTSNRLGQAPLSVSMTNVKLLSTLSYALNDGKSIWTLTIPLVKTVLIIFILRSVSSSIVCGWSRSQDAIDRRAFYSRHNLTLNTAQKGLRLDDFQTGVKRAVEVEMSTVWG